MLWFKLILYLHFKYFFMKLLIARLVLLSVFSLNAQQHENFPESFLGVYKGDLLIQNTRGTQTIGMEFHLNASDTLGKYDYKIVYIAEGNRQERNYNLIVKDPEKGQYVVDENNGIQLEAKQFGNKLFSVFEVQKSLLFTTETFYEDYMTFEIIFSNSNNKVTSGGEADQSPEVFSFPVSVYQYARLLKQ